jgi:hypothetical protein
MMVDWGRLVPTTGEVTRGISEAAIIDSWLERDDEGAFIAIVAQVSTSSTTEVDRLDAALLSLATSNFSADSRRRLIKFYAIFKITEMRRYQEFRGFPQLPAAGTPKTGTPKAMTHKRRMPWPRTLLRAGIRKHDRRGG